MPVGPEFQDPPPETNQLPYFVPPPGGADGPPFYEQTVTLSGMKQFAAAVADPNLDDTLTVRWVANYPPNTTATKLLVDDKVDRTGSMQGQGTSKQTVTCDDFSGGADHNLVVIVSDQGFANPKVLANDPIRASNPFLLNFDDESNPQLIATMTGWRIAGCP